jgi:hypothetical protein
VDRDLNVVAWNARREQGPLGLARVRALGRNLRDVFSSRGLASVMPAFQHVLDTATPCEERRTSKDGRAPIASAACRSASAAPSRTS